MPLTAVQLRNAKPRAKAYRLFDSNGLYVEVSPSGRLLWRMKYRFALKEKRLALGQYPRVTLADARQRAQEARRDLGDGIDPGVKKQAAKAARAIGTTDAFEAIAREWHATKRDGWSPTYAAKVLRRLELDVFPWLGGRSITTIESPDLLSVMRRIEGRGALETTKRNLEACSQVFRYAIATGRAKSDPARDLKGAIKTPITTHFAAITEPARLGELLRAVDGYQGSAIVVAALKLTPMLLLRPTELRASPWADFDLDEAVLRVAGQRMKRSRSGKLHGPTTSTSCAKAPRSCPFPALLPSAASSAKHRRPPGGGGGEFPSRAASLVWHLNFDFASLIQRERREHPPGS